MKRRRAAQVLAAAMGVLVAAAIPGGPSFAYSFVATNGVLMGTVCRSGGDSNVYPLTAAAPVGTSCTILDSSGNFKKYGVITGE
jgi:hypothetical protein